MLIEGLVSWKFVVWMTTAIGVAYFISQVILILLERWGKKEK